MTRPTRSTRFAALATVLLGCARCAYSPLVLPVQSDAGTDGLDEDGGVSGDNGDPSGDSGDNGDSGGDNGSGQDGGDGTVGADPGPVATELLPQSACGLCVEQCSAFQQRCVSSPCQGVLCSNTGECAYDANSVWCECITGPSSTMECLATACGAETVFTVCDGPNLIQLDNCGDTVLLASCGPSTCGDWECGDELWVAPPGAGASPWSRMLASVATDGSVSQSNASIHDLALLPTFGPLLVAWSDNRTGNYEVYVRGVDSAGFTELGGAGSGSGLSNTPEASLSPRLARGLNLTFVAWVEDSGTDRQVLVKAWDGNSWISMGAVTSTSLPTIKVSSFALAASPSDEPVLALSGRSITETADAVYVLRRVGTMWVPLGAVQPVSTETSAMLPSLVFHATTPRLAYAATLGITAPTTLIAVREWNGDAWPLVNSHLPTNALAPPTLQAETAVVSWCTFGKLSVAQVVGSAWVQRSPTLPLPSCEGATAVASWYNSVADSYFLVTTWSHGASGNAEVYAATTNTNVWTDLAGLAVGGVSRSNAASTSPRVAVFVDGRTCIGWIEARGAASEVVVRCQP